MDSLDARFLEERIDRYYAFKMEEAKDVFKFIMAFNLVVGGSIIKSGNADAIIAVVLSISAFFGIIFGIGFFFKTLSKEHRLILVDVKKLSAYKEAEREAKAQKLADKLRYEENEREIQRLEREIALEESPLFDYFGAIEGGEIILYYLLIENDYGEKRYKIGITSQDSVNRRYSWNGYTHKHEVLMEKCFINANSVEKAIKKKFSHLVTNEHLIGTKGTEIFSEDVLKLDV